METPAPSTGPSTMVVTAALASAGAGLVHAAAAGTHNGDVTLAWLFALTAAAQLAWAALALVRPTRWLVAVGVALNAVAVLAWFASRSVGLFGPLAEVEAIGMQDALAAALGTMAVVTGAIAVARPTWRRYSLAAVGVTGALVLALAMPAMAAEHTHGASHAHDHAHGDEESPAGDGHAHGAAEEEPAGHEHASEVSGPIVSLDDARLSKAQQTRGTELLTTTRTALEAFPDEAAILAAGYTSIGDGRTVGRFEHFVNWSYLSDAKELDADAIESIVTQRQADGSKRVVSAMYILESGSTMEDVPDVAGELSVWHDHQNLCWDASGTRLAGVVVDGQCRPGGTLRPTPPMLHVWLESTPCGPFAGVEGHGGSCAHAHQSPAGTA